MAINQSELGDILRKGLAAPEEETTEEVNIEDAQDKSLETIEDESQTEAQIEQVTEEVESAEEIAEESAEIQNLNELAEAIEVDPEWLYNIKVPISDGRDPISLSELKDKYQEYARVNDLKAQFEIEQANFKTKIEEQEAAVNAALTQFQQMPQELMTAQAESMSLAYQYNNFDWETLEKENPGQAALAKQNLATAYQQSQEKINQVQNAINQATQKQYTGIEEREKTAVLKFIPDWVDNKTRLSDQANIRSMLHTYGYADKEIDVLIDHRALRIAHDLMKLKNQIDKSKSTVKKLKKVPRVVKPGAAPAPKSKADIRHDIVDKAKKSKSLDVKVKAIGDLLMNRG